MKRKLNIKQKISAIIMSFMMLAMFFEVGSIQVISVMGFKYPNGIDKDITSYYLPSGEKINLKDQEERDIYNSDFVLQVTPVLDYWMISSLKKDKIERRIPPEPRRIIKLKKIDDFRKESLAAIPIAVRWNKKDYFREMDYVGHCVDKVIIERPLPDIARKLYAKRQDKARLRPFLSYLAYGLAGGNCPDTAAMLAAVSETTNLHLYCHNFLLDDKRMEADGDRLLNLLAGGQFFSDLTAKLVCESRLKDDAKVLIMKRLADEIDLTCSGQIADRKLNVNCYPNDEAKYLEAYSRRSALMSGAMYGFSVWLGYAAANNENSAALGYDIGKGIGLTLQLINDIADFSLLKEDAFSDWRLGKVTAPLYYLMKFRPNRELSEGNLASEFVSSGAYESSLKLVRVASDQTKALLANLDPLRKEANLLKQVLVVGKDNKYFRQLRSLA